MVRPIVLLLLAVAVMLPGWSSSEPGLLAEGYPDDGGRFEWSGEIRPDGAAAGPTVPATVAFTLDRCLVELAIDAPIEPGSVEQECAWRETITPLDGKPPSEQTGRAEGEKTLVRVDAAAGKATGSPSAFLLSRGPLGRRGPCRANAETWAEYVLRFRSGGRPYTARVAVLNVAYPDRLVRVLDAHE